MRGVDGVEDDEVDVDGDDEDVVTVFVCGIRKLSSIVRGFGFSFTSGSVLASFVVFFVDFFLGVGSGSEIFVYVPPHDSWCSAYHLSAGCGGLRKDVKVT